jgi:hypothetical protein
MAGAHPLAGPGDWLLLAFVSGGVSGDGWPADRDDYRGPFSLPGVAEAVEHHIVALLGQNHAAPWQVYPEPAADQQKQGRALLARHPLRTLVALGMDGPFDLNIIAAPGIIGGLEMPKQPPPVNHGIRRSIAHIDRICHGRRR